MAENKVAFLVGSTTFPNSNGRLNDLKCPGRDVQALASYFSRKTGFAFSKVLKLVDKTHAEVRLSLKQALNNVGSDDTFIFYYSGHGKLNEKGELNLTTKDTEIEALNVTSVQTREVCEMMKYSKCKRFIVLLDCCYSAQIDRVMDKETVGISEKKSSGIEDNIRGSFTTPLDATGLVVISSSTGLQVATESADEELSTFTGHICKFLENPEGERAAVGWISINDLFIYLSKVMRNEQTGHSPSKWEIGATGDLIIGQVDQKKTKILERIERVRVKLEIEHKNMPKEVYDYCQIKLSLPIERLRKEHANLHDLMIRWSNGKVTNGDFISLVVIYGSLFPNILDNPDVKKEKRWWVGRNARRLVLDYSVPTYLLDSSFHFVDWNAAFDEIIAKKLGLTRSNHAAQFVESLENRAEVIAHSLIRFGPGKSPLVDVEDLVFRHSDFGKIKFKKIATQVFDELGSFLAWIVQLNVNSVDKSDIFWETIQRRLEREANWSRYAAHYDQLVLNVSEYKKLIQKAISLIPKVGVGVDLCSGTGNSSLALVDHRSATSVWSIESNDGMLGRFRSKIFDRPGLENKVHVMKGDVVNCLNEFILPTFDSALMINGLYAVEDPQACIREVYRTLKPGGVFVLSTSYRETNIEKLFAGIREDFSKRKILDGLRFVVESSYESHVVMKDKIQRDTIDDIKTYLKLAGFTIESCTIEYFDAVVLIKVIKND